MVHDHARWIVTKVDEFEISEQEKDAFDRNEQKTRWKPLEKPAT